MSPVESRQMHLIKLDQGDPRNDLDRSWAFQDSNVNGRLCFGGRNNYFLLSNRQPNSQSRSVEPTPTQTSSQSSLLSNWLTKKSPIIRTILPSANLPQYCSFQFSIAHLHAKRLSNHKINIQFAISLTEH